MNDPDLKVLIGVGVVVLLGAAGWYYYDAFFAEPELTAVEVEVVEPAEPATGPQYPVPEPEVAEVEAGELVPLPPLDESDAYFLLEVDAALGPTIESLLVREDVIDRLVATTDNLPRPHVSEKIRPVRNLGLFHPDYDEEGNAVLGPTSYARFDLVVATIANADLDAALDTYRRFYPLFQTAFERLGYPDTYFNDRVVAVIDDMLATPEYDGPIYLEQPNVLYVFADPDLEALSSGQKLILRMGPDNAATLRVVLRTLRAQLVGQD